LIGVHVLCGVTGFEIATVRAIEGAPCSGVAAAYIAQEFGEIFFDISAFRAVFEAGFEQAFEREDGFGKRAVGTRIDGFLQAMQCFHARSGNRSAMRRHFSLEAAEPSVIEDSIGEETLALAHGALIGRCGGAVL
jgi:hypothetical protein